jgi:hypothetical protein
METVPIQTVVTICTALLSIIDGLILAFLAKMFQEIKELKEDTKTLEEKKVDKSTLDDKLALILEKLEPIKVLQSGQLQMQADINIIKTSVAVSEAVDKEREKLKNKLVSFWFYKPIKHSKLLGCYFFLLSWLDKR